MNRRGIVDHVDDARLAKDDFAVYQFLLLTADSHTGLVYTCSTVLANRMRGLSVRQAQRVLARLERGYLRENTRDTWVPYIKRFRRRNTHGVYAILVHNYGTRSGLRTDAISTLYETDIKFVAPERVPGDVPGDVLLIGSTIQEKEKDKRLGANPAPSSSGLTVNQGEPSKSKATAPTRGGSGGKSLSRSQHRFREINTLAREAERLLRGGAPDNADLREAIKCFAARHGIPYGAGDSPVRSKQGAIDQAITVALERVHGTRDGTQAGTRPIVGGVPLGGANGKAGKPRRPRDGPASREWAVGQGPQLTPEESREMRQRIAAVAKGMGSG